MGYYGLVIVLIRTVPKHQQSVASAIWSVMDIIGGSCGTYTVGRIAAHQENDIASYSMTLLIAYAFGAVAVVTWSCVSHSEFDLRRKSTIGTEDTSSLLINGRITAVYKSVDDTNVVI